VAQISPTVPQVSVIIPARNEASRIESCLTALTSQDSTAEFEIIVVDNGSTDETSALASAFSVTVVHEPRVGRAIARNTGIRAARGNILAFTDADCVPCRSWLRELLIGRDDPEYGCFVGEIVPLEPVNAVARYIHERRLICQLRLLSQSPPVAATGSIAYRRSVFDEIGMFDEAFAFGEDGDLFWRMVRSERFRYRYNPKAIVGHRHPESIRDFAHRSFREGTGLTRFRRKHHEDLPSSLSSHKHAAVAMAKTIAGCALYPARVARGLVARRLSPVQALTDPLLDKVVSLGRLAGALHEYSRGPSFVAEQTGTEHDDLGAFRDQVELDLNRAPLLSPSCECLRERVRTELGTLGHSLAELFPESSVLLTGSLFAGEGRASGPENQLLLSDYDLFVVTPRLTDAFLKLARPKLDRLMASLPPRCACADIGLVWKPLLDRHLTTAGGAVIAGSTDIIGTLRGLPAPRGFSALLHAYRSLTAAPLNPETYADLCASALVRAARAMMFAEKDGRRRREWIALFSIEIVGAKIEDWTPVLGRSAVDAVRDAADFLLRRATTGPNRIEHEKYVCIMADIAALVPVPRKGIFTAKQFHRMLFTSRTGFSGCLDTRAILEGFQTLAASWTADGLLPDGLSETLRIFQKLGLPASIEQDQNHHHVYESLQIALADAACYNPHRVCYSREGKPK